MASYAKDKPADFTNSIERVAIVGAGGTVGSHVSNALLQTGKHTITALTRLGSTNNLPNGIIVAPVDYNDESTLIAALKNQQFLIITMAPNAPKDTHSKLVQAAAKARVSYIMPNGYAGDIEQVTLGEDTLLGPIAKANREEIERLGMKWITVCCGFWFDYSLAGGESRFGFDFDKKTLTLYDDGNVKNSSSTLAQVGRAVAKVLSSKELPDDKDDDSLTVSNFHNRAAYLNSFVVSQRDLFESVKRVTGTSDADWTVTHESSKKRYEDGMAQVKRGDMSGFSKLLYARAFFPEDPSDLSAKAQNELLSLPKEDLDEATKDGIALVEVLKGRNLEAKLSMPSNIKINGVAIIGAGLGGTALALALHRQSIPCRIFEARGDNSDILSSGATLTPNGCRVLDELGILSRLEDKSYICEYTATKDADDKTVRKTRIGSNSYPCYRLYRLALLKEMKAALAEKNVPIFYGLKLERIISDTSEGVVFQVGGRTESAALVIGSDGIHSTLRRHITDLVPVYTNLLCVYGHIPTESVKWPGRDFAAGCTVLGKPGGLFMVPEVADGSDLMVGTQFAYPETDRKGWKALASDPASLAALLRKDYDEWHDTAQHAIDELCKRPESILCWPFYAMPKLPSWSSSSGNVITIGDAAHAKPASSGQGVYQALEDAFSLAKVLSGEWNDESLPSVLGTWQWWRQDKIDRIHEMMRVTNMMRSSEGERSKMRQAVGENQSSKVDMQLLNDLDLDTLEAKLAEQRKT
ncbi:isoflavone reductase family [Fusarium pseudoanthophilum]|uniref:Isoflavone reductase family n=1 Tax=Fusarium pseudoanthophilum TaxID=48495 RepID=A0A8H5KIP8_9HYPO|nr:isoflavone reductase family [Fusarium pseudoanthophilum]